MPAATVELHLRWSDVDAYGHVNNVAIVGLLEQARVRAFWSDTAPVLPPLMPASDVWVLVADAHRRRTALPTARFRPVAKGLSSVGRTAYTGTTTPQGMIGFDVCLYRRRSGPRMLGYLVNAPSKL